ncbi:MAG TPA: hypothetical protein VL461_03690 [Dictyobacter sp.]|jgi:hypothetical protein|nr:hypothetical protein [Dictyobacter sp.]
MKPLKSLVRMRFIGRLCSWASWVVLVLGLIASIAQLYNNFLNLSFAVLPTLNGSRIVYQTTSIELRYIIIAFCTSFLPYALSALFFFLVLFAVGAIIDYICDSSSLRGSEVSYADGIGDVGDDEQMDIEITPLS